jgi:glycerol uptake facilitator protein
MRELVAKALGTLALTFSVYISQGNALIIGLTLAAMIYILSPYSGAHLNPAVTFSKAAAGSVSWMKFANFVAAQLLGGVAGYGLYYVARRYL